MDYLPKGFMSVCTCIAKLNRFLFSLTAASALRVVVVLTDPTIYLDPCKLLARRGNTHILLCLT